MAVKDPGRVQAGIRATPNGVNSGQSPDSLAPGYVSFGVNSTCRGGFYHQRPGYKKLEFDYGGSEGLQDGLFQGAASFKPRGSRNSVLIAQISGQLFKFDVASFAKTVTNITPHVIVAGVPVLDESSSTIRQSWMIQAEDWLIVQNGYQRPIFYDGVKARRAGAGEMRPGRQMEYTKGRVGYIRPDRQSIRFGDIVYGPSGTLAYNFRDGILKDTENDFLNEGGEFTVPGNFGDITAIRNVSVLDASMGQGPVQVFTEKAVFSMNLPADRTTWKDLTFPAQTATLIAPGATAQDSTINVNGDIWYRSRDGIRSLVLGVRNFGAWGNVPMSREMTRVIEADDERLLGYSSAILFQNRLLVTASPANSFLHGTYHRGLIALDFDIVSSMSNRLPPAYDALWTGIRILKLLVGEFDGVERAFAFVLSSADKIELWEITAKDIFDNMSKRIEWFIESPGLFDGIEMRKLVGGEMFIDQLSGTASFNVRYRPDQYAGWIDWHSWSECADYQTCTLENCEAPMNLKPQYRAKMRFPSDPAPVCITEDNRPSNLAYTFQLRVGVTGAATIKSLAAWAYVQLEEPYGQCRVEGVCQTVNVCDLPVFGYSAEV